jgi:RNA polymerase sigma-70 factor (ECF subfamily)
MEDAMIEDERVARIGEAVRAAIQMLPDILSDVLWRHHAEGQTVPFIAAAIGVPESAIKMRLMRGRAAIRAILAEDPRVQRD